MPCARYVAERNEPRIVGVPDRIVVAGGGDKVTVG